MLNYEGPQNQKILWGPRFIIHNSEFIIHHSQFTIIIRTAPSPSNRPSPRKRFTPFPESG